jgi:hypothetical protein
MAMVPGRPSPPPWTNQDLTLYHGTCSSHQASILGGINVRAGRRSTDFGQGFYTTTNRQQADAWALQVSQRNPNSIPIVVRMIMSREVLAKLDSLWFVRGDLDADDYWSLVRNCRTLRTHHGRLVKQGWYDVVCGPVARDWRRRFAYPDTDQISFHTPLAAKRLNASQKDVMP